MKGLAGVFAGMCCALVIACASATAPRAVSMPPTHDANDPHAQITELETQINADRETMGLPEPPPLTCADTTCGGSATPMTQPPPSATDPKCHPGPSNACHESCRLADSICENASKICKLASDLAGDTWAAGKCVSANTTCEAAHTKCCGCQL